MRQLTSNPEQAPDPGAVGEGLASVNAAGSFGGNTPRHFEDHVSKSAPRYADGHSIVLAISFISSGRSRSAMRWAAPPGR